MTWLATIGVCAAIVEIALRLPILKPVEDLRRSGVGAVRVLAAKSVSEHWKEKAMGGYALKTLVATLKIAGMLAVVLLVAAVLVMAIDRALSGFQDFILSSTGVVFSIFAASAYFVARRAVSGV